MGAAAGYDPASPLNERNTMRAKRLLVVLMTAAMVGGAYSLAVAEEQAPTTQPAKPVKKAKLGSPWNKVSNLTEEQKSQIVDIRTEIQEKIKALQEEERSRCLAVLNEEQRGELDAIKAREDAERKQRDAELKKGGEEKK
jgi:Spy/CpxP family protein refolding chaperone